MGPSTSSIPFLERQEIELKATELIRALAEKNPALDAFDIARQIAIPVLRIKFPSPDIAGKLVREVGQAEIWVRLDDPYERQNFTVAHELGHLILQHPGTWEDTTNTMYRRSAWSSNTNDRRAEYQANLFAAALLMPENLIRDRWQLLRSIHYVAPYFRVSKDAIRRRLEDLGLIVITPKGMTFFDLSDWAKESSTPKLPDLSDDHGPIPRFPPILTDELGRIIPMNDAEWAARSSAFNRVLGIADARMDNEQANDEPQVQGRKPGEVET